MEKIDIGFTVKYKLYCSPEDEDYRIREGEG